MNNDHIVEFEPAVIDNDKNKYTIKRPDGDPHNGKPCTMMEISPGCKYIVTYSEGDHSFVLWNVESTNEGRLNPDIFIINNNKEDDNENVILTCVSDNRE